MGGMLDAETLTELIRVIFESRFFRIQKRLYFWQCFYYQLASIDSLKYPSGFARLAKKRLRLFKGL
jgi:hypothetical protein